MRMAKLIPSCLLIVVAVALFISGCSDSGGSDFSSISGAWQNPSTKQKVYIDFSNNKTTITIGETILSVTIKPLTSDSYTVHVSDKSLGEKEWKLSRVRDANGKSFTLNFERDGATENLERVKI